MGKLSLERPDFTGTGQRGRGAAWSGMERPGLPGPGR